MVTGDVPAAPILTDAPAWRMTYGEIAALAQVRRPVPTNWSRRHPDFPAPVAHEGGQPLFDGREVVTWLTATGHGNAGPRHLRAEFALHEAAETRSPKAVLEAVQGMTDYLGDGSSAVLLGPADVLAPHGDADRLRRWFLATGLLKAVVVLPGGAFPYRPGHRTAVWVLGRTPKDERAGLVLLHDLSARPPTETVLASLTEDIAILREAGWRADRRHVPRHGAVVPAKHLDDRPGAPFTTVQAPRPPHRPRAPLVRGPLPGPHPRRGPRRLRVLAALLRTAAAGHARAAGSVRAPRRVEDFVIPDLTPAESERYDAVLAAIDTRAALLREQTTALDDLTHLTAAGLADGTLTLHDPAEYDL